LPHLCQNKDVKSRSQLPFLSMALFLLFALQANAGTFFCDFNSSFPANCKVIGDAMIGDSGGANGGGVLKLTIAKSNQGGTFILDPLDDTNIISGFTATFKALMSGGRGGDGFSFCFAPDYTNGIMSELGDGSGLVVTFDTYKNSADRMAPAIRVYWQKKLIGETEVALRLQRFAEVFVQMSSAGMFNLAYDGKAIFTNLATGSMNMSGRFAFGSRTGGWFDHHWIDDLNITTDLGMPSFVETFSPADDNAAPDTPVEISLTDWRKVELTSLRMKLDGFDVTPVTATNSANLCVLQYQPPVLLPPGSSHVVYVAFEERGAMPLTNSFSFRFSVNPHIYLSK
jgi:hypothetical protein